MKIYMLRRIDEIVEIILIELLQITNEGSDIKGRKELKETQKMKLVIKEIKVLWILNVQ